VGAAAYLRIVRFYSEPFSALNVTFNMQWDELTLASVPQLIAPVRKLFAGITQQQLNTISTLGGLTKLFKWLMKHASTDEFNRLLNV
jgi:hypothetical protein